MSNNQTLKEILEGIEAFVQDMEELGADVTVAVAGDLKELQPENRATLLAVVKLDLAEDLEVRPRGQ